MESSRRDLFIDMVVDSFIFKNSQMTLSPCFISVPKTGVGLPEIGLSFYCVLPRISDIRIENCQVVKRGTGYLQDFSLHPEISLVRESIANPCMDFQKPTDTNMDIDDFWMSVFNFPYKRGYPHWYPGTDIHARTFRNRYL